MSSPEVRLYLNFVRAVFEKFDVKQSNDLEICPRSLTVVSTESCRLVMYVKCSEYSERMKRKSPFPTTPFSIEAPSPANPREYLHKPYTVGNYVPWATFLSFRRYGDLLVENRQFVPTPPSFNALARGDPLRILG